MKDIEIEYESSYYLSAFESRKLKICGDGGKSYAYMTFGKGDSAFDINLPVNNGFVLSQVVEMDALPRVIPSDEPV